MKRKLPDMINDDRDNYGDYDIIGETQRNQVVTGGTQEPTNNNYLKIQSQLKVSRLNRLKMEDFFTRYRALGGVVPIWKGLINKINNTLPTEHQVLIEHGWVIYNNTTHTLLETRRNRERQRNAVKIQRWWRRLQVVLMTLLMHGMDKVWILYH